MRRTCSTTTFSRSSIRSGSKTLCIAPFSTSTACKWLVSALQKLPLTLAPHFPHHYWQHVCSAIGLFQSYSGFARLCAQCIQIYRRYRWHTAHVTSPYAILGPFKNSTGLCLTGDPCAKLLPQHGVPSILRRLYIKNGWTSPNIH